MERLVLWLRANPGSRDDADDEEATEWARSAAERASAAGGRMLARVGAAVAAAFEPPDLIVALDLALDLLQAAERADRPLQATGGVALGELRTVAGADTGSAIDRAQLLANRAHPGELVLDAAAREAAEAVYLFGRKVRATPLRGHAIDRGQPRRDACRQAVRYLQPAPVAPITEELLRGARERLLRSDGVDRIVLRGPSSAGAAGWIARRAREGDPPLLLRIASVPGGLEPLGSLRLALMRLYRKPTAVRTSLADLGAAEAADVLGRIARGESVDRHDAVGAIAALLVATRTDGRRAWIVVDPVSGVDAATLEVIAEALDVNGVDAALVSRLPVDARLPAPLREGDPFEVTLPSLREDDARRVAETVLGDDVDEELARRVAVLGGETPLGVEEAARTLAASGDLVFDGQRFLWRVGPRGGPQAIPTEALLAERLAALPARLRRMLEVVCMIPAGADRDLVDLVGGADGLTAEQRGECLARLRLEAFVDGDRPEPSSEVLRTVVVQSMPPARAGELHRFVATALEVPPRALFVQATRGYYLAEGGLGADGADALLAAAREAGSHGFSRSAVRLAAAAVQYDPSPGTRAAASAITRALTPTMRPSTLPPPPPDGDGAAEAPADGEDGASDVARQAIEAILARDFDRLDRCLDLALADGRDRGAIDRLRAIGHVARGDTRAAMRTLARARAHGPADRPRLAREALAMSLILLGARQPGLAVRCALKSLAVARELKDPRGEAVALQTLARCYGALGRNDEARAIEEASPG